MVSVPQRNEHRDIGPDSSMDLDAMESVEVTPDYRAELSVPFTTKQLATLERVARADGISPATAAQRLVEEALAVRAHR